LLVFAPPGLPMLKTAYAPRVPEPARLSDSCPSDHLVRQRDMVGVQTEREAERRCWIDHSFRAGHRLVVLAASRFRPPGPGGSGRDTSVPGTEPATFASSHLASTRSSSAGGACASTETARRRRAVGRS